MSTQANIKNLTLEYLVPVSEIFTVKAMTGLAKGIARAKGLATFSFTHSDFNTSHLKLMFPGFCNNRSLSVLSLAHNELDDACGTLLGKIISTQGFLKDELVWLTSLRNEVPKTNLNEVGINTLILDGNKAMKNTAIRDMCAFVKFDTWFRSLSLNHLDLSRESLEVIVDCLDKNKSIIMLGLEGNQKLKSKHIELLNRSLARNINEYTADTKKEKTIRKALKKLGGKGISETDFQNFESHNKSLEASLVEVNLVVKKPHVRTLSELDSTAGADSLLRPRPGTASSGSKQTRIRPGTSSSKGLPYHIQTDLKSQTATSIDDVPGYHSQNNQQFSMSKQAEAEPTVVRAETVANMNQSSLRQMKTEGQERAYQSQKLPREGGYRVFNSTGVRERTQRQNSAHESMRRPHPSEHNKRGPLTELVTQSSFDEQMLSRLDEHISQVKQLCQMMPMREADTKVVHDSIENISTCVDKMKSCGKLGPEGNNKVSKTGHHSNILSVSSPMPTSNSKHVGARMAMSRVGIHRD